MNDTVNEYILPEGNPNDEHNLYINPHLFCELLKCKIRGVTIEYSSYKKKMQNKTEKELEVKLEKLHRDLEKNENVNIMNEITEVENNLKTLREKKITGIMARAKARWIAEGEKCTNYFCNLEKRQYAEKLIPKIIDNDGSEICDQFEILEKQRIFYENLYSSSNPVFSHEHEQLFFDQKNPFVKKLTPEQSERCEGNLQKGECLENNGISRDFSFVLNCHRLWIYNDEKMPLGAL